LTDEVLFNLAVTKTWLRQVIVALPLICHISYRGEDLSLYSRRLARRDLSGLDTGSDRRRCRVDVLLSSRGR